MDTIKCLVKMKTHSTIVRVNEEGHIYCFKFNQRGCCELADFVSEFDASDYILEPLAQSQYYVDIVE